VPGLFFRGVKPGLVAKRNGVYAVQVASARRQVKSYLLNNFRTLEHPILEKTCLEIEDIGDVAAAFLELLAKKVTLPSTAALEEYVLRSFEEYGTAYMQTATARARAAIHLAEQLESFLRKLALLDPQSGCNPTDKFKKLLTGVGKCRGEILYEPSEEALEECLLDQGLEDAVLHHAYYVRNQVHKARAFTPGEADRYWRSVVGAFLLTTRRHLQLAPKARRRMDLSMSLQSVLTRHLPSIQRRFAVSTWRNPHYIPLLTDTGDRLDDATSSFLSDSEDGLLVVSGQMGAGKSIYLQRLCVNLADEALEAGTSPLTSQHPVPLYLDLALYKRGRLLDLLLLGLDPGHVLPVSARSWTSLLPARFVVCLDSLERVLADGRDFWSLVSEVDVLAHTAGKAKIIVASRPHAVPAHWRAFEMRLAPLIKADLRDYYALNLVQLSESVQQSLSENPHLAQALHNPMAAEAACEYWRSRELTAKDGKMSKRAVKSALHGGHLAECLYRRLSRHVVERACVGRPSDKEGKSAQASALAELTRAIGGDSLGGWNLILGPSLRA